MRITPALLVCGAVVMFAAPVWADRIETGNQFRDAEFSAGAGRAGAAISERFGPEIIFGGREARLPEAVFPTFSGRLSSASRDSFRSEGVRPFAPGGFEAREFAFIFSRGEKKEGSGNSAIPKVNGGVEAPNVVVAEPESASLLLVGLAAVGIWMRRRVAQPLEI